MSQGETENGIPKAYGHVATSSQHVASRAWTGLYSFLTAHSVLMLGWATILTANAIPSKAFVLIAISLVGAFTALQWSLLSTRMWHYHLEYERRLRELTNNFTLELQGPGSTAWREVEGAVDKHWKDGKKYRWLSSKSGNHIILFSVPLFLGGIHVVMFGVALFTVVCWPTAAVWPPYVMFVAGVAAYVLGLRGAWTICKPILDEQPSAAATEEAVV